PQPLPTKWRGATIRGLRRLVQCGEGEQDITARNLIRQAWPFMVAGVLATLQLRMVILILQGQVGNEAVGWYAAANRVVEAGRMLPNAAFGALFPMLAALVDHPSKMRRVFRQAALFLVVYGVGVGGIAFVAGRPFVRFVFGGHFEQAGAALVILAWAILPGGLRGLITLRLYAYHREWWVNGITGVALIIQLIVGVRLIGEYGITGAVWTIVIAEIVLVGLLFGTAWRSGDTMLRGH
ncbi:MAG: polysaccharide biosynthesis C-terminal domain-containing protein, partial [Anaerolineae bacterium]|nr:polysaccharide biosynthesis C-terminal domain-containing protein [Anaerolineae bacterium]